MAKKRRKGFRPATTKTIAVRVPLPDNLKVRKASYVSPYIRSSRNYVRTTLPLGSRRYRMRTVRITVPKRLPFLPIVAKTTLDRKGRLIRHPTRAALVANATERNRRRNREDDKNGRRNRKYAHGQIHSNGIGRYGIVAAAQRMNLDITAIEDAAMVERALTFRRF